MIRIYNQVSEGELGALEGYQATNFISIFQKVKLALNLLVPVKIQHCHHPHHHYDNPHQPPGDQILIAVIITIILLFLLLFIMIINPNMTFIIRQDHE